MDQNKEQLLRLKFQKGKNYWGAPNFYWFLYKKKSVYIHLYIDLNNLNGKQ